MVQCSACLKHLHCFFILFLLYTFIWLLLQGPVCHGCFCGFSNFLLALLFETGIVTVKLEGSAWWLVHLERQSWHDECDCFERARLQNDFLGHLKRTEWTRLLGCFLSWMGQAQKIPLTWTDVCSTVGEHLTWWLACCTERQHFVGVKCREKLWIFSFFSQSGCMSCFCFRIMSFVLMCKKRTGTQILTWLKNHPE